MKEHEANFLNGLRYELACAVERLVDLLIGWNATYGYDTAAWRAAVGSELNAVSCLGEVLSNFAGQGTKRRGGPDE